MSTMIDTFAAIAPAAGGHDVPLGTTLLFTGMVIVNDFTPR